MSGSPQLTSDVDIDIARLFSEIWRQKYPLLILIVASAAGLYLLFSGMEPRYRSDARILIENRESVFTRPQDGAGEALGAFDERAVGSQVQVVGSDELVLKVIDRMGLVDHREFAASSISSPMAGVLTALGLANSRDDLPSREKILFALKKRMNIYAADKSRVIVVGFWAHDRQFARDFPNALAEEYLEFNKDAKRVSTAEATDWLGPEIDELRGKLRDSEANVASFRASSDIVVSTNNSLLSAQQLSEASSELSRVRTERSQAEGKIASVRTALGSGGSLDAVPEVIASPLIQRLHEREVELQAQISEMSTALLPEHPRMKALQSQRADFRARIRAAARDILTSLESNVDLYTRQEEALGRRMNQLKAEVARVNEAEVELRALEREAAAQRQLLESYLAQYREAASRQNREYLPVDARIISRAILPIQPYFPKVLPYTVAGTTVVTVLAGVFILGLGLMTGKALKPVGRVAPSMLPERMEEPRPAYDMPTMAPQRAGLSAHALAPAANIAPHRMAVAVSPRIEEKQEKPDLPAEAANDEGSFPFRYALEAVLGLDRARIAMIAPGGDRGSLSAWHLARSLARAGRDVVIVDLTGTAVTSRRLLGTQRLAGLRDMLAGRAGFEDAVYRDLHSPVHVLPAGRENIASPQNPMEQLSGIAKALEAVYEFIVFDCGCAAPPGVASIANDEILVMISQEGVEAQEARECESLFRAAGYEDTVIIRLDPPDRESAQANAA